LIPLANAHRPVDWEPIITDQAADASIWANAAITSIWMSGSASAPPSASGSLKPEQPRAIAHRVEEVLTFRLAIGGKSQTMSTRPSGY
jgi:hypothetical protein